MEMEDKPAFRESPGSPCFWGENLFAQHLCSRGFEAEVGDQGQVIGGDERRTRTPEAGFLKAQRRLIVAVVEGQQRQYSWIGAREATDMSRPEAIKAAAKQFSCQSARPLVEVTDCKARAFEFRLHENLRSHKFSGLEAALHVACAE